MRCKNNKNFYNWIVYRSQLLKWEREARKAGWKMSAAGIGREGEGSERSGADGCRRAGGLVACGAGRRARRQARPRSGEPCPPRTCRASRGRPRGQPACPACQPASARESTRLLILMFTSTVRRKRVGQQAALRITADIRARACGGVLPDTGAPHSTREPQEIEARASTTCELQLQYRYIQVTSR